MCRQNLTLASVTLSLVFSCEQSPWLKYVTEPHGKEFSPPQEGAGESFLLSSYFSQLFFYPVLLSSTFLYFALLFFYAVLLFHLGEKSQQLPQFTAPPCKCSTIFVPSGHLNRARSTRLIDAEMQRQLTANTYRQIRSDLFTTLFLEEQSAVGHSL